MQVKNLNAYTKSVSAPHKLIVALQDGASGPDEEQYFTFVHEALATRPDVAQVILVHQDEAAAVTPDVVVKVQPSAKYDGSGWNYFITFPGFLLFTHAWNGYVYSADIDTEVAVAKPGAAMTTSSIHTFYNMRHCDFTRGAVASSGWYTPFWGGLNLIFGFFMVPYDTDATPEFQQAVRTAYGQYIANSIIEMANTSLAGGSAAEHTRACAAYDPTSGAFHNGCGVLAPILQPQA
jgi:hypothetical protein